MEQSEPADQSERRDANIGNLSSYRLNTIADIESSAAYGVPGSKGWSSKACHPVLEENFEFFSMRTVVRMCAALAMVRTYSLAWSG